MNSASPALSPEAFQAELPGRAEDHRTLYSDGGFEVTLDAVPKGGYDVKALSSHCITVQCSAANLYAGRFDGRVHEVRAIRGMSWVKPAGVPISLRWDNPAEVINIWITQAVVEKVLEVTGAEFELLPRLMAADPLVEAIAYALRDNGGPDQPTSRLLADGLRTALIAHLASSGTAQGRLPDHRGGLVGWRLRRVLEYVDEHLVDDLSLAKLASLAGLSEHHFSSAFRQSMGAPPHRFLIEQRIDRARQLLREEPALSVIDVAMTVGFTTSTHFATMFRKVTGMTPTDYRNSL